MDYPLQGFQHQLHSPARCLDNCTCGRCSADTYPETYITKYTSTWLRDTTALPRQLHVHARHTRPLDSRTCTLAKRTCFLRVRAFGFVSDVTFERVQRVKPFCLVRARLCAQRAARLLNFRTCTLAHSSLARARSFAAFTQARCVASGVPRSYEATTP